MRKFRVLRSDRLRNKCAMTGKRHPELNSGLKENIFTDTDFSRFTSLFPPYSPIALLPYKERQMGESL